MIFMEYRYFMFSKIKSILLEVVRLVYKVVCVMVVVETVGNKDSFIRL